MLSFGLQLPSGRFYRVGYSRYSPVYNYFILFCATIKTITPEVLWMIRWAVALCPKAKGNNTSGHPQHQGFDSFDCCTERYGIAVLLPNSTI